MSEPKVRSGSVFDGKDYHSKNKAKKASREYQQAAGGLGRGSVVVRKK